MNPDANSFLDSLEVKLSDRDSDLSHLSPDEKVQRLQEKVSDIKEPIIPASGLTKIFADAAASGRPIRVKYGIDPTGPDIHLGHAIPLLNARRLLLMGAHIDFVVGSFTARIGDPSLRNDSRPPLTRADVERNVAAYKEQAARVIPVDHERVHWHDNNEWFSKLPLSEWMEALAVLPAGEVMRRNDFRERMEAGQPLTMAEVSYSALQAYDSFQLRTDIEVGGWDQLLNMMAGRRLMSAKGLTPQTVMTFNLLPGTTGERDHLGRLVKMSKSRGNYIPLSASPEEVFARVMSVPDSVTPSWFRELTEIRASDLETLTRGLADGSIKPLAAKKLLARTVTATLELDNGVVRAKQAERAFVRQTGRAGRRNFESAEPIQIQDGQLLVHTLADATGRSQSDVRRTAQQGGVEVKLTDGTIRNVSEADLLSSATDFEGTAIRVGKRSFFELGQGRGPSAPPVAGGLCL